MSQHKEYVVVVEHTNIVQGGKIVIEDLSFRLRAGEFVYLIGKTGSGKSSILRTLYLDLPFSQGKIEVAGYDLTNISRKEIPFLRRRLGIIFQDFELFTDRSVEENLLFVMKATGWSDRLKIRDRIDHVLAQVGLAGTQKKMPHQLSGGEQQRVAIARALINEPLILLADEPTGNLDPEVAGDIWALFSEINQRGTAVIMATHQHSFLKKHPERVLYCVDGKVNDVSKDRVIKRMSTE